MDVNLRGVGRPIQEFIHKLIEINDCVFYQVRLVNGVLDHPVARPVITLAQLLRCFGGTADEEDAKMATTGSLSGTLRVFPEPARPRVPDASP